MRIFLKILAWYSLLVLLVAFYLNLDAYFKGDQYALRSALWEFPMVVFLALLLAKRYLSKIKA
ncbi:hypothetical protein M1349_01140 [Patescibacteria group bacterium]|nr:hypothetical protein [Patescibacteria group bacterium]